MDKKRSGRIELLKYALMIPAFVGMCLVSNAQDKERPARAEDVAGKVVEAEKMLEAAATPKTFVFAEELHDFGTIKEADGKVTAVFTFENKGTAPLVVSRVVASCGCTTPEWTKEPVQPGGTGQIKAVYDPRNRVYPFDKTISVYSNGNPAVVVLRIRGNVEK